MKKKNKNDLILIKINDKISIICKKSEEDLWNSVIEILERFKKSKYKRKNLETLRLIINSKDIDALKDVINEFIADINKEGVNEKR